MSISVTRQRCKKWRVLIRPRDWCLSTVTFSPFMWTCHSVKRMSHTGFYETTRPLRRYSTDMHISVQRGRKDALEWRNTVHVYKGIPRGYMWYDAQFRVFNRFAVHIEHSYTAGRILFLYSWTEFCVVFFLFFFFIYRIRGQLYRLSLDRFNVYSGVCWSYIYPRYAHWW